MKSIWKNFRNEIFAGGIVATSLFLVSTHLASACGLFDIESCQYTFMAYIMEGIGYLIATILGIGVAIEAWLIGIVLNINANIMQTPFVQTGFSISLSIANLAFVLGIIVIAIATILRSNSYGIKQLLWKLVVMAILVNFGLVIMAPIFAVGNSLTQYFMNCIGSGGQCAQNTDPAAFGTTFAAAFSPQDPWKIGDITQLSTPSTIQAAFGAGQNNPITSLVVPLFGIVFIAIDMALIIFVLGAFIILLTIRYLYIAILAILLPLAWASWVFPGFSHHWKSWWNNFIRWTFFAPVTLFFVYLALLTAQAGTGALDYTTYTQSATNSVWASFSAFINGALEPIFEGFLKEILIAGLIIGGMIAADKMGIKFAGSVVKTAESGGKAIQGFVGKQSKKAGRAAFRKAGGEKAVTAMREGRLMGLQRVPGLGWAASRGASLAGRAIEPKLSNRDLIDKEKKNVPKNPQTIKQNLKGNMNTETNLAYLSKLIEEGELDDETMVGNRKAKDYLDQLKERKVLESYGFMKEAKDADKVFGSNKDMRDAAREVAQLTKAGQDASGALKKLDTATDSFLKTLNKSDASKMNSNAVFGKKDDISEALIGGLLRTNPGLIPGVISKMKGDALDNFEKMSKDAPTLEKLKVEGRMRLSPADEGYLSAADGAALKEKIDKSAGSMGQAMINNVLFVPSAPAGPAEPAQPQPAAPPPPHS